MTNPTPATCNNCNVVLHDGNWYPSSTKNKIYLCKKCVNERVKQYQRDNPDKIRERLRRWRKTCPEHVKTKRAQRQARWAKENTDKMNAASTKHKRNKGVCPFNENRKCSMFLGCHIAERVLSYVFNNVERMPINNPGYDFICGRGKKIDVKSGCLNGIQYPYWHFTIKHNTTADYFLCIAFDNRKDLNLLHVWLLPGDKFSRYVGIGICQNTIHKWDEYRLDIAKVWACCETLKRKQM